MKKGMSLRKLMSPKSVRKLLGGSRRNLSPKTNGKRLSQLTTQDLSRSGVYEDLSQNDIKKLDALVNNELWGSFDEES